MSDIQPQPNLPLSDTQPRKVTRKRRIGVLISALVILIALALGGVAGYAQGIGARVSAHETSVRTTLSEQYALAEQDFVAKRYDFAEQRLRSILKEDQGYPGAVELFTKLQVQMAITPSSTPTLVPSATPTPDLRSQETIFAQAQNQLKNSEWTNALASLDSLRKADPTYKTALVDAMYFTGLRNRGMDQILGVREYATTAEHPERHNNLEGGIYDLTLAERFGPLDGFADGMHTWARYYILGASFWELDWAQAVNYFSQVADAAPNLHDASNVTASERYYQALLKYGDLQATAKKLNDRCLALSSWAKAQNISPLDNDYTNKFSALNLECNPPTKTPEPEQPTPTTGP